MIEVDTTYLWQTPGGVDAKRFCASVPVSLFPTQTEFSLAWANEMSASKQASRTARLQLTLRQPVVSHSRHQSASFSLNQQLSFSCSRSTSSRPGFRSADSFSYIHADMGISVVPMPAFFVFRNTSLSQIPA